MKLTYDRDTLNYHLILQQMYKVRQPDKTTLKIDKSFVGERIEEKVERVTVNNEPITDGAPEIYTDRSAGVEAQYNIKTDRWEIAIDAMDLVAKTEIAKREQRIKERNEKKNAQSAANTPDGTTKPQQ